MDQFDSTICLAFLYYGGLSHLFPLDVSVTGIDLIFLFAEKTVVWYPNGVSPVTIGSKVELTFTDGLVLTSPNGVRLWNNEQLSSDVFSSVLNDTGNFVLGGRAFNTLWQTFDFPCDTLLPSQVILKDGKLSSRLKESNFSKGRFELVLKNDSNLVIHSIILPSGNANEENYYESGTVESNTSSPGAQLVFDKSGDLYLLRENSEKFYISGEDGVQDEESKVSPTNFYLRATLNFDGVFSPFKHPKNSTDSGNWTTVWSHPKNICQYIVSSGSGVCGYNTICTLGDDKRPTCRCPKRYSLLDPDDPHGSCKPDFIQGCAEDEQSKTKDLYEFQVLNDTDWPLSDAVLLTRFTDEQCRKASMEDCMCSVAIWRLGDSCWKKKLPLSN
ncbi:G-type lectin S-receptor-like serine/threonine-protein kinase RLK1 [Medicago truncatula]|uniref:G-type lectin S-receptor-like serine/threonine-protein kinase RLK1 n=1 Tax=Medicago truncatula TaxID=3880 RepID=UPI0019686480|nr:G-type lectin S-receptor-like serine/threonine-protein kinase RLK1 [Medicago truncatula]